MSIASLYATAYVRALVSEQRAHALAVVAQNCVSCIGFGGLKSHDATFIGWCYGFEVCR